MALGISSFGASAFFARAGVELALSADQTAWFWIGLAFISYSISLMAGHKCTNSGLHDGLIYSGVAILPSALVGAAVSFGLLAVRASLFGFDYRIGFASFLGWVGFLGPFVVLVGGRGSYSSAAQGAVKRSSGTGSSKIVGAIAAAAIVAAATLLIVPR